MRNLIIFLFHLLCFATANHALAQQKVLVSDYFFKEDSASVQNKLLNIQEYRLDEDIFLYQRLNTLLQHCNDKLAPNCANGFAIYFRTQMNGPLQLFISPVTSAHDLDNPKLMGVFLIDQTPFFIFNLPEENQLFIPTAQTISLQLIINTNELSATIFSMLHEYEVHSEEKISYKGFDYVLLMESCREVGKSLRSFLMKRH